MPISNNLPSPADILFNRKLNGILPRHEKLLRPNVDETCYKKLNFKTSHPKKCAMVGLEILKPYLGYFAS